MKTLLFVPLLISLVACNATTTEITSGGVASADAPHIWGNKTFPKTVYISEDFTPAEVANITDMSAAWDNAFTSVSFLSHPSTTVADKSIIVTSSDSLRDSVMAIYKTTKWPSDLPNALAVTQIFGTRYNAGESDEYLSISHADILVNYHKNLFRTDDTLTYNYYDLQTVVLHEMGHFIGLGHRAKTSDRTKSVMFPSIFDYENKRMPKAIDITEVTDKYGFGHGALPAIAAPKKEYKARNTGTDVKVLLELYPNGECLHRENGVVIKRHQADLSR